MTTMISEPPPSKTRLGVGLDANRRPSSEQQAWKKNIGTKPIPARLAGGDVKHGRATVQAQRLYQLVRQAGAIADRTFEIRFLDPGVQAYAFTFG